MKVTIRILISASQIFSYSCQNRVKAKRTALFTCELLACCLQIFCAFKHFLIIDYKSVFSTIHINCYLRIDNNGIIWAFKISKSLMIQTYYAWQSKAEWHIIRYVHFVIYLALHQKQLTINFVPKTYTITYWYVWFILFDELNCNWPQTCVDTICRCCFIMPRLLPGLVLERN